MSAFPCSARSLRRASVAPVDRCAVHARCTDYARRSGAGGDIDDLIAAVNLFRQVLSPHAETPAATQRFEGDARIQYSSRWIAVDGRVVLKKENLITPRIGQSEVQHASVAERQVVVDCGVQRILGRAIQPVALALHTG